MIRRKSLSTGAGIQTTTIWDLRRLEDHGLQLLDTEGDEKLTPFLKMFSGDVATSLSWETKM